MKKLQIDVLAKAPSLTDIEDYNAVRLRASRIFFIFCGLMIVFGVIFTDFYVDMMAMFFISSIAFVFGMSQKNSLEEFVLPSACPLLLELSAKYPEVAAYRMQVISHGREFLQSEYDACVNIVEEKACKELYGL